MPPASDPSTEKEARFMAECLKNFDSGRGKIDMVAVALAMGYKNPHSAGNRFKILKTKHGIKMDCFYASTSASTTATSPGPKAPRAKKTAPKNGKTAEEEQADVEVEESINEEERDLAEDEEEDNDSEDA